jgi:dTDP-L-rhamnose 4-epimerase
MAKNVLITGGAGFIGSYLADELIRHGYRVRALDNLSVQVHGPERKRPRYLHPEVELIVGDVRDPGTVGRALRGIGAVYHFAAMVGVGQSMYEVEKYTSTNDVGTAVLLEALIKSPVERLVVASSMSIYGEGLYRNGAGRICEAAPRPFEQLRAADWELRDAGGKILQPVPTPETKAPCLASVYALNKFSQEKMCLLVGKAYQIPTVALRFFNVFGSRQSLSNPYTGVIAIFASRLLNGQPPLIYEDGGQQRDFVSVYDAVSACRLVLEKEEAAHQVFNIGSGRSVTVLDVAQKMARILGKERIQPRLMGKYRVGDIRHCFADISRARQVLGYEPRVSIEQGMIGMAEWLEGQIALDLIAEANAALHVRGLTL